MAFLGGCFHCLVPLKFVTVGTPEGDEEKTFERIKQWNKEDKISANQETSGLNVTFGQKG